MITLIKVSLQQLLRPQLPDKVALSASGKDADFICPGCGDYYHLTELQLNHDGSSLTCQSCGQREQRLTRLKGGARIFINPGFYVLLTGLLALILWFQGVGNPSAETLRKADAARPWNEWRHVKLWILQAATVRQRAAYLADKGDPDAVKWYGLLIEDFEKISHALKKEEVYWDLQFAKAQALAGAGRLDKARQLLDELEAHFREDPEEYLIFLYHRGRIALKQGRKDDAIRDLEKLLRDLQSLRIDVVQKMLDRYSGENDETFWSRQRREQIEEICGLNARPVELKKGTLYLFKAHDLKSDLANEILKAHGLLEEEEQKEEESHRLIIEEGD